MQAAGSVVFALAPLSCFPILRTAFCAFAPSRSDGMLIFCGAPSDVLLAGHRQTAWPAQLCCLLPIDGAGSRTHALHAVATYRTRESPAVVTYAPDVGAAPSHPHTCHDLSISPGARGAVSDCSSSCELRAGCNRSVINVCSSSVGYGAEQLAAVKAKFGGIARPPTRTCQVVRPRGPSQAAPAPSVQSKYELPRSELFSGHSRNAANSGQTGTRCRRGCMDCCVPPACPPRRHPPINGGIIWRQAAV